MTDKQRAYILNLTAHSAEPLAMEIRTCFGESRDFESLSVAEASRLIDHLTWDRQPVRNVAGQRLREDVA